MRKSWHFVSCLHLLMFSSLNSDFNNLIMDYLISQGYPHAAQKFATEANMRLTSDVNSITQRIEIRDAIHSGNIQTAIERINEMNPQVGFDMPSPASA